MNDKKKEIKNEKLVQECFFFLFLFHFSLPKKGKLHKKQDFISSTVVMFKKNALRKFEQIKKFHLVSN